MQNRTAAAQAKVDQAAAKIAAVAGSFEFNLPIAPARPGWQERNAGLRAFIAETLQPEMDAALAELHAAQAA